MNKDLRNTFVWFVLATLLVMVAFWQAQLVVINEARASQTQLPPPLKTKRAIRPGPDAFQEDPHERFVARLATGASRREIGWIVEDFRNAGLDLSLHAAPIEDYLAQRKSCHRWYLDTLTDALQLGPDQRNQASAKLGELFDQTATEFRKKAEAFSKPIEQSGQQHAVVNAEPIQRMISSAQWLENDAFAPWNLCALTPSQMKLVEGDVPFFSIRETIDVSRNVIPYFQKLHPAQVRIALLRQPWLTDVLEKEMDSEDR